MAGAPLDGRGPPEATATRKTPGQVITAGWRRRAGAELAAQCGPAAAARRGADRNRDDSGKFPGARLRGKAGRAVGPCPATPPRAARGGRQPAASPHRIRPPGDCRAVPPGFLPVIAAFTGDRARPGRAGYAMPALQASPSTRGRPGLVRQHAVRTAAGPPRRAALLSSASAKVPSGRLAPRRPRTPARGAASAARLARIVEDKGLPSWSGDHGRG